MTMRSKSFIEKIQIGHPVHHKGGSSYIAHKSKNEVKQLESRPRLVLVMQELKP